jgi:predicted Ser/Thr protein kinase
VRADPLIGSELAGYRVEELVGRGGMGVVYRAEHLLLGRKDAIKLLSPEFAEDSSFRERFLRESRLAASIDHPSIVPIYHAGESDGLLFIAMRYVEGTDLRTLLREQGKLDPERTSLIVEQVASALDAAHAFDLVHRDVKPGNILLAAGDRAYLTDFGIAKHTATHGGLTQTGSFVGTLGYAAPEQIEGKPLDGRSDVYSLGCVAFQCLCGGLPYEKDSEVQLIYAHLLEPPPAVRQRSPELPPEMDAVIARALAKSREDRFATAGELAAAFRGALEKTTPTTRVDRPREAKSAPPPTPVARPAPAPARPSVPAAAPPERVPPPSAPVRSPARQIPVKLVAAAVLAAAALIFAVVVFMRDGGGGFPDADEEELLSLVPAGIRDSCSRTREMPDAVAAVACRAGAQTVSYFRFAGTAPMRREHARRASLHLPVSLQRDAGACDEPPRIGERRYTAGAGRGGRVFCAPSGNAVVIGWMDEQANVFALSSRPDGDPAALYRWWERDGGPLRPGNDAPQHRTSTVPSRAVLYRETFSSREIDWRRPNTRLARYSYSDGRYRITVRQPSSVIPVTTANATPPLTFGSVRVEAVAARVGGQRSHGFGLVCRSGNDTLYTLQIRSDGLALIRKRRGTRAQTELAAPAQLPRRALIGRQNRIAAICDGGRGGPLRLQLSLNGRRVLSAVDRNPRGAAGAVGVFASSLDRGGVTVAFDDFRVTKR